jgi:predicted flap endonuclease-1-like 5' DNA nuclease
MTTMLRNTVLALVLVLGTAGVAQASHYPIDGVPELIPEKDAAALKAAGVATTQALLDKAATPKDRKALAKATKIPDTRLRAMVEGADLMRVQGIGPKMVRLLGHLKVKTIAELRKQDPAKLAAALDKSKPKLEADLKEKLPDQALFAGWIAQAKQLPIVVK